MAAISNNGATRFKQAEEFERRIRDFLRKLGFRDVAGGPNFVLGNSSQIDACGGIGKILFVIDCHSPVEHRRRSVRSKIRQIRGERLLLLRGMARSRKYRKYNDLRIIVATRRVQLTQADRNFASIHPRVYLWDDAFIGYYSDLARKLGKHARNDLFGEVNIRTTTELPPNALCVPALKTRLHGRTAFLFFAMPETLLRLAYVARREKGKEEHYQRLVDSSRLEQIGKFLSDRRKRGFFANNVILNFEQRLRFHAYRAKSQLRGIRAGQLVLPNLPRSAWIIDGQHRLYGFARTKMHDLPLAVVAFQDLTKTKQAELFLEINRNQKAIRPNLIWDLEGEINPATDYGIISNAVKALNNRGPLAGLIGMPSLRRSDAHLKLGSICEGILDRRLVDSKTETMADGRRRNPLYANNSIKRLNKLARELCRFFDACAAVLKKDWDRRNDGFFCTNNGINVLLRIYERMIAFERRAPSGDFIRKSFRYICKAYMQGFNSPEKRANLRKITSSEAVRADIANQFEATIERGLDLNGFALRSTSSSALRDRATALERDLAKFVATSMAVKFGADWFRTRTNSDLVRRYHERSDGGRRSVAQALTLGELLPIIIREDNWNENFKELFGPVFRGKDAFKVNFEALVRVRNRATHSPGELEPRDEKIFELYEGDLREALKHVKRMRPVAPTSSVVVPVQRQQ
jgi:DGQHR domain-containing protein